MTDKCQFCHGTKIEPGQPDCIWCDNTGLAHHVRIGSATFKFFKDSVTRGLGVMLVSTEGAEHVPHSDFFKADPAPSAEEEAAFRAYLAADPMATYWSTWQAARKGTQSQLAALREELATTKKLLSQACSMVNGATDEWHAEVQKLIEEK